MVFFFSNLLFKHNLMDEEILSNARKFMVSSMIFLSASMLVAHAVRAYLDKGSRISIPM